MQEKIEELLHRRTDLSTFLVHLTRGSDTESAKDNLLSILEAQQIDARSPLGMAQQLDSLLHGTSATQRVVCFSETPLEHTWMMVKDIEKRQQAFAPYGLVFTKTTCRRAACNPVWYLDITTGHDWLTEPIRRLVKAAMEESETQLGEMDVETLASQDILQISPFIEQMGKPRDIRKEFWWEREWRHVGDFRFTPRKVVAVLAPEADHFSLKDEISGMDSRWARRDVPVLDPAWGLERMIATLAGIDADDAAPWPE